MELYKHREMAPLINNVSETTRRTLDSYLKSVGHFGTNVRSSSFLGDVGRLRGGLSEQHLECEARMG